MAISSLALPVDVPWKRLCVSGDMIDKKVCDRDFPYRWRSSVAVFSYEPPKDDQTYDGMIVSYLKVACTITGFQEDPDEVGLKNRKASSYWNDPRIIENYADVVSKYYGCYGSILEVAVAPAGSKEEVAAMPGLAFPYFIDFEPKKREVYELVSETGEVMSRSLENINVHKGTTTTDSHENLDVFLGQSGHVSAGKGGGGAAFQSEWGTRDLSQEQYTNLRTTDRAREMREVFSHTTQLTQMYHQFNSYHLGTNRAVFFMLPRPHVMQSELTFVNGPRQLEGIQEIFLVVMRPDTMAELCVEAYLETGHIAQVPVLEHEKSTGTVELHIFVSAVEHEDSFVSTKEDSETYTPPDGWEIDLANNGGFKIEPFSYVGYDFGPGEWGASGPQVKVTDVTADHLTVWGTVSALYDDRGEDDFWDGQLDAKVTVHLRKKEGTVVGHNNVLFLTGRGVCCCPPARQGRPGLEQPSVVFELPIEVADNIPIGPDGRMTVRDANRLRAELGHQVIASINHPERYPAGTVRLIDTRFVGRALARSMRGAQHADNHRVADIQGIDQAIARKVSTVAPYIRRSRLLTMSMPELADRFGLEHQEARTLRRAALGLEGPPPDPKRRWDRPRGRRRVPPAANVRVPDLVGISLTQALLMLRQAGLASEPEIVCVHDPQQSGARVLEVTPPVGTTVPSNARVVLKASSRGGA